MAKAKKKQKKLKKKAKRKAPKNGRKKKTLFKHDVEEAFEGEEEEIAGEKMHGDDDEGGESFNHFGEEVRHAE